MLFVNKQVVVKLHDQLIAIQGYLDQLKLFVIYISYSHIYIYYIIMAEGGGPAHGGGQQPPPPAAPQQPLCMNWSAF